MDLPRILARVELQRPNATNRYSQVATVQVDVTDRVIALSSTQINDMLAEDADQAAIAALVRNRAQLEGRLDATQLAYEIDPGQIRATLRHLIPDLGMRKVTEEMMSRVRSDHFRALAAITFQQNQITLKAAVRGIDDVVANLTPAMRREAIEIASKPADRR